jgi:quercetin dioxygenase-like cupin family protein
MKVIAGRPTTQAPAEHFLGEAWIDRISDPEATWGVRISLVRFAPGARNAWHAHPKGQTLHVTDGIGRIQSRGGEVIEIRAGDTVVTPAGEWHWHGAAPDHFMTHLAIWEAHEGDADPAWGDLVSDAEYHVVPREAREAREA